jgi:very-short-patch-repair endonuclease
MNLSEIRIWLVLKNSLYNFRRQKIIGNYIVDFVSLRNKIIVEIDGNSHENKIEYDEARIKYLIESGYKVMIVRQKINFPSEELKKFIFDEIEKLMKDVLVVKII